MLYNKQKQLNQKSDKNDEEYSYFVIEVFKYLKFRLRQIFVFLYIFILYIQGSFTKSKGWMVQRMFWGRSSMYRSGFHFVVISVTIVAIVTGISTRLNITSASESQGLNINSGIIGRQDILSQSGTAESISSISADETDYKTYKHVVQKGDTLSQIAEFYGINSNSIRWANNMESDSLKVGEILRIPEVDGAFVKVEEGDTLEEIAAMNNGNVPDIIDLNQNKLSYDNPEITVGMELFIPGGEIPLPTPVPTARPVIVAANSYSSNYIEAPPTNVNIPSGTFIHPLTNCGGWSWSRGYSSWHRGADMAKNGGCWINAAAAGTVIKAQWGNGGEGFHIVIDHGNGIWTRYYHGNGSFAVNVGDYVSAGQSIMYMGNTGYSFGTHLHFEVVINGVRLNPEGYVGLR